MCIEYELRWQAFHAALHFLRQKMPLIWAGAEPDPAQFRVSVGNPGAVLTSDGACLTGEMMRWGWDEGRQVVFNSKSEGMDFPQGRRVLILAAGYYEYTEPMEPMVLGQEQHFFTMKGERWFFMAGIARDNCFSLLTAKAGPDVKRYCRRQVCVLPPAEGLEWLKHGDHDLLKPGEAGAVNARTLYNAKTFVIPNNGWHERTRLKSGPAAVE